MSDDTTNSALPTLSVIIPCLNEERYIAGCLDSILANGYPLERLEIVVIDGMSGDGTRDIVADYAARHPNIRLIDNPGANKSRALNTGLAATSGDIVARADAHAIYDPGYYQKCVDYLENMNADNVGGVRETLPGSDTLIARAIAYSINNRFAAGDASYRTGVSEPTWTDIVFLFSCRRTFLEQMGPFMEALTRGQDREFNIRVQDAGGKALLAPDITSRYFARARLGQYTRWIYDGGAVPLLISRITGRRLYSTRNFVPAAFVLANVALGTGGFFWPVLWCLQAALMGLYGALAIVFSLPAVRVERNPLYFILMPLIFLITHVFYGLGTIRGVITPVEKA